MAQRKLPRTFIFDYIEERAGVRDDCAGARAQ